MSLAFVSARLFFDRSVLRAIRPSRCLARCPVKHRTLCVTSSSARERRRAAGRAREAQHKIVKRDLEANPRDVVPTVVMVPSDIRERCSLTARLARVKIFLEQSDITDPMVFRHRLRASLVRFFPELEDRGLLRASDGFDLRLGGSVITDDLTGFRQGVERCENAGSPLYVEIIPHNAPPPKAPFSERVSRVRDEAFRASQDPDLKLCMISFYKFVTIAQPALVASILTRTWAWMGIKGRVYVAGEGINAQLAVPETLLNDFKDAMNGKWVERGEFVVPQELHGVFLNIDRVVDKDEQPFEKLNVRPREKILADGFDRPLDWNNAGREVKPEEWHKLLKDKSDDVVVLDCRNDYESDVGRFEGAEALNTRTFRETWDELSKRLSNESRDKPILTYCTGGIRCVKVNAYLEQKMGFKNTARLAGGIVSYARTLREQDQLEESMFKGVNHVFDGRMGEVITGDLIDECINCGQPCNVQTDCANVSCPRPFDKRIFVQCEDCTTRMNGACCENCRRALHVTGIIPDPSTTTRAASEQSQQRLVTDDELYADSFSTAEEPLFARVRQKTAVLFPNRTHIMSSNSQGLFLKMLVQISGATRVLEIGTFTGYSALCMASGMPEGGKLITCELDDTVADVASSFFKMRKDRPVSIDLLRGDALKNIESLFANDNYPPFDLVFIDADKGGYGTYVQLLLDMQAVRHGGLLIADNTLFRGEVATIWKETDQKQSYGREEMTRKRLQNIKNVKKTAQKLHNFNRYIQEEPRVEQVVLPFRDGLTIARRIK